MKRGSLLGMPGPLAGTSNDLTTTVFSMVRRGFDPIEVMAVLKSAGDEIERLQAQVESLQAELAQRPPRPTIV